jgi:glutamate--cysteine ligase
MTTTIFKGDSALLTSVEDLVRHFKAGEKPRESWKIGTEHEKAGFYRSTHQPVPYEGAAGIRSLLERLNTRFGWNPVYEGPNLIALMRA